MSVSRPRVLSLPARRRPFGSNPEAASWRPSTQIEAVDALPRDFRIAGGGLSAPRTGDRICGFALPIAGWVAPSTATVHEVQVVADERIVARTRPEAEDRGDHPDAVRPRRGFALEVGTLDLPRRFAVRLDAVLEDGSRVALARLTGSRSPLPPAPRRALRPLALISLGRSGSTALTSVLAAHPLVVALPPLSAEGRVSAFWLAVLRQLADPSSAYRQVDAPDVISPGWWLGDGTQRRTPGVLSDCEPLRAWLIGESVAAMSHHCLAQIDACYNRIARAQGKRGVSFFVEKYTPGHPGLSLLRELYADARQLVLARDVRDVFCSVTAFNARRGYQSFSRDRVASELEYLELLVTAARALVDAARQDGSVLVRYEDLVLHPRATVRSVLSRLGLPSGARVVERMAEAAEASDEGRHHITAGSVAASIGRFQRDLPPALHRAADALCEPVMRELGYPAGGSAALAAAGGRAAATPRQPRPM